MYLKRGIHKRVPPPRIYLRGQNFVPKPFKIRNNSNILTVSVGKTNMIILIYL